MKIIFQNVDIHFQMDYNIFGMKNVRRCKWILGSFKKNRHAKGSKAKLTFSVNVCVSDVHMNHLIAWFSPCSTEHTTKISRLEKQSYHILIYTRFILVKHCYMMKPEYIQWERNFSHWCDPIISIQNISWGMLLTYIFSGKCHMVRQ